MKFILSNTHIHLRIEPILKNGCVIASHLSCFTRAIFIWQGFFDKFYLPVWTGKIAVFSLVKFTCLKSRKNLTRKNLPNETYRATKRARVDANANDKFFLTSFICLCGRTKLPFFSLSSKLVQKLACQLLNKSIGELLEQASKRKRKSQTNTTTPGTMQPAAQFQTKLARLLTEVFCYRAGAVQERWSDYATTILLENLRPKESL